MKNRTFKPTITPDTPCRCGRPKSTHPVPWGSTADPRCSRFKPDPAWLAHQAKDEPPEVPLRVWDAARPRSSKTARARAAGGYGVGPSDFGGCHKAIEYRERPPEDYVPDEVDKAAAILGTVLHDGNTKARKARYPWRKFGLSVTVPGLDAPGELDEYDPYLGRVTDYKTAGEYAWDRNARSGPPEYEWKQVLTYGLAVEEAGGKVTEVQLLVWRRANGEWESFTRPYDRAAAIAAVSELHAITAALEEGRPLPRVRAGDELLGPSVNALCARYCPAVRHCWDLDHVPADRSPEGWVLVKDDEDVAATLAEYDAVRVTENESKKRKDYARTLLEGVEPGEYGPNVLTWSGGRPTSKPDPEARIAQLERAMTVARENAMVPPDPADLPYPEVHSRTRVTINVKPVRAGKKAKA